MPETIGIRELKNQTSKVLRVVREEMVDQVITLRGKPIAVLRPLTEEEGRLNQMVMREELASMRSLAREVSAAWTSGNSAVDLVSEQRR